MASSSRFYSIGTVMGKIVCDAVTSEATGHDIENTLDFNLDTYWSPTSTAAQNIDFDLQATQDVNGFSLWICNHDTDHTNSDAATITLSWATDNTYTSLTQVDQQSFPAAGSDAKLIMGDVETTLNKRYWRLAFADMASVVQVGQIFLWRSQSLDRGDSWPEDDQVRYCNTTVEGPGGRTLVRMGNRNYQNVITRSWGFLDQTDYDIVQAHWIASKGGAFPLIYNEGTDYWVVRFQDPVFQSSQTSYQAYDVTLTMVELPYVSDGEYY